MARKKLKIAVVTGGNSNERKISLITGREIAKNLDRKKYSVKTYDTKTQLKKLFSDCLAKKIDLCLIALHGRGGEDGSIQGLLDLLNAPYTGSGVLASAIGMDKIATKRILAEQKILMPADIAITKGEWRKNKAQILRQINQKIGLPGIIKPNAAGSSVGVTLVKAKKNLAKAINSAFRHDNLILIEKYIKGREMSVPILGNRPLPVIEICPKNEFFDYQAKYTDGYCEEIVPARINKILTEKIQAEALKVHQALGCRGLSRVDFIARGNKPYFLETNTIPGMTPQSLCPKSAQAAGIEFPALLDKIIGLAL